MDSAEGDWGWKLDGDKFELVLVAMVCREEDGKGWGRVGCPTSQIYTNLCSIYITA
jgi:hypothetical protein